MKDSTLRRISLLALVALLGLWASTGRSDVVILKDGFALQGKVMRETERKFDKPSKQFVPQGKGFWLVDDNVRRTIFSFQQISKNEKAVDDKNVGESSALVRLTRSRDVLRNLQMRPVSAVTAMSAFDENWRRVIRFRLGPVQQDYPVEQWLLELNPMFARLETNKYRWSPHYMTRELGPETVVSLLHQHPTLTDKPGQVDNARRIRIFKFLLQAGPAFFDAAERELDAFLRDAPKQKKTVDDYRALLKEARQQDLMEQVELAIKVGRHGWARAQLDKLGKEVTDQNMLARVRTLQSKSDINAEALKEVRKFLQDLPGKVTITGQRQAFGEAANAISAELDPDNLARLEAFLTFARQADSDQKQSRPPTSTPAELMALAVSGWLLGSSAAETKVDVALKLWQTRKFVLAYQKTGTEVDRQQMLKKFNDAPDFDVLAQLLSFLPPPEPAAKVAATAMEMEAQSDVRTGGVKYLLQAPAEYHVGREYPVLIVLNQVGQKPSDILQNWSTLARNHGYFLVAPTWEINVGKAYTFTDVEQAAVLDVVRDLKRKFQIDPDRVFLSGFGEGGNMAFDVGLAHPDLFAGVAPIGGAPRYFAGSYLENAALLPFYTVCGDMAFDPYKPKNYMNEVIRPMYERWVAKGFACLYVEYRGRTAEWFEGELPYIFDWMSRKKRATANPLLPACSTMRPGDNRFWWLSGDDMSSANIKALATWNSSAPNPGYLGGELIARENRLQLKCKGFKKLTVWIGPGMVDISKPVKAYVNLTPYPLIKVTPRLDVLLEDFFQRGDRKQVYFAKLEYKFR